MFVEIMSCNLAVELLQKANVVIARNIVNSSKATATAPVDSNVSREVGSFIPAGVSNCSTN